MEYTPKETVEVLFNTGIDVVNRRVFLDTDIDCDSSSNVIKGLYLMETESKEKPVEMFISSFGGDIYEALAIYDIMHTLKCPIRTFAFGKCMSAAPLILAAGDPGFRWVSPHVAFMHHNWSAILEGKGHQITADVKHCQHLEDTWTKLLAKHSNQPTRWWNTKAGKAADFYYGAEQAIEWGLADNIWVERD